MARSTEVILDSDIVRLRAEKPDARGNHEVLATLFWGDRIPLIDSGPDGDVVRLTRRLWNETKKQYEQKTTRCLLPRGTAFRDAPLLKVRFVDVGQGDGAIVETPKGRVVLVDGGEESHMRRYMSSSFAHVLRRRAIACDAIVVSHGDADHFAGLTDLALATRNAAGDPFVTAERVFHSGLVKRSSSSLGATATLGGDRYVVDLHDDLRTLPDESLSRPFREWKAALAKLRTRRRGRPRMRRLEWGDHDAFDFLLDEGLRVDVLGPVVDVVDRKAALPWLGDAGRTINGHSIVLKLTYGNVRFLFGADLNEPSEERLLQRARDEGVSLTAEILKVPHHGSADFSPRMLEAVRPVVSVVSSGDENTSREYIHPRAGLVGALGRFSRGGVDKPLVYVTEMVAFFRRQKNSFRYYTKTSFGIVHVRTDGERVLVVTNSGRDDRKEAYAFHVDERGEVQFEDEVRPV